MLLLFPFAEKQAQCYCVQTLQKKLTETAKSYSTGLRPGSAWMMERLEPTSHGTPGISEIDYSK